MIANNIANVNTKGYRRRDVDFEGMLRDFTESGRLEASGVEAYVFQPENTPVNSDGNDVVLEVEVGEMIKNTAMYKTYLRLMSKIYQQMALAMETGS